VKGRVSISRVQITGYRALTDFSLRLTHLNVLVGPNNCGKSTLIGSFRLLAQALRRARSTSPGWVIGPKGRRPGWHIPEDTLPIAAENIHSNYEEIDTLIEFQTSNRSLLSIYFPDTGGCIFFADLDGAHVRGAGDLRRAFPQEIQVVPVLGPLEHEEAIVNEETVRKNLMTTRASRNFRNYWFYNPGGFDEFADLVSDTWPGMTIEPPERSRDIFVMFCLENRISRELYWAGFGFQIWLQLLTHISRSKSSSLIVIDEPEVYLHPDVQRQLLGILRALDSDVLLATHSTEIMSEADPTEILLVDKSKRAARRLRDIDDVQGAFDTIGSAQNITLTRLARNRRVLFVEGDSDFVILRRFARQIKMTALATGTDLTPLESGGFSSWQEIRALAAGFERTLGVALQVGALYDRDYWCDEEIESIRDELGKHLKFAHIHERKEIENYLLIPSVLDRALTKAIGERNQRTGSNIEAKPNAIEDLLIRSTDALKNEAQAKYISKRLAFFARSGKDPTSITIDALKIFDDKWNDLNKRLAIVPGKQTLAALRTLIASSYGITLTDHKIVSEFKVAEVPADLIALLKGLDTYRLSA